MKKIKIFLASSDDLAKESLELSDLVEHLNLILEKQDIHIYLAKWDYLDEKKGEEKSAKYEETLDECDLSLVIFGDDFGSYTEVELTRVYERFCKKGINPQKLYVYFRTSGEQTHTLKKFQDSLPEQFVSGNFADVNVLIAHFVLQFQNFLSENDANAYCEVKLRDGKAFLNEQELFIDMMKVPFVGNNEEYIELRKKIEKTQNLLADFDPEDEEYADLVETLRKLEEKKEKMESSLWSMALYAVRLSNRRCHRRLQKAIELFYQGNSERACAILDTAELDREAEELNKDIKQFRKIKEKVPELLREKIEGLKGIIEAYKFKIKTLENENDVSQGWGEEVADLHNKVMKNTKEAFGENSEEYIYSLMEAGVLFRTLGRYSEALTLHESALKLSLSLFGEKHLYTANSYGNVGFAYSELGNHDKALEYGVKALKISEEVLGERHPDTAADYNNVGLTYGNLGNHDKALEYLLKSLKIREEVLGERHPVTAESYNNVGVIYSDLGNHDKALEYGLKALKISEEVLGEQHPDTATSYNNVGYIYGNLGNHDKELEYELKALKIREEVLGERHPVTAESYNNVGYIYGELGNHDKALEYGLKALKIREEVFGEQHPDIAASYNNMGMICGYFLGNYDKALEYQLKALKIREEVLGERHPDTATSYNNVGCTYGELDNHDKALEYELKALDIRREILGEMHPDTAISYGNVGYTYSELGDYEKALEYRSKAVEISKVLGNKEREGFHLTRLGKIYAKMGDKENAKAKFMEALALLPEDHPDVADIRKQLEEL